MIYARGQLALASAMINSCHTQGCDTNPGPTVRDITIYAYGENAMQSASLRCYGGSTCNLYCFGNACSAMASYQCYSGAVCNCDGPDCPIRVQMEADAEEGDAAEVVDGNDEKYAFMKVNGIGSNVIENSLILLFDNMNGSMMLLVGAGAVVFMMVAIFYFIGSKKKEYKPLE